MIQRGTWDINLNLPVVVFWSREEFINIDEEANLEKVGEDSLDEGSNRTVHSIMETFNLTWKEALEEFITYTYKAEMPKEELSGCNLVPIETTHWYD